MEPPPGAASAFCEKIHKPPVIRGCGRCRHNTRPQLESCQTIPAETSSYISIIVNSRRGESSRLALSGVCQRERSASHNGKKSTTCKFNRPRKLKPAGAYTQFFGPAEPASVGI